MTGGGREAGGGGTGMRESCEGGRQEKNEGNYQKSEPKNIHYLQF